MKKKLLLVALVVVLVFACVGCGEKPTEEYAYKSNSASITYQSLVDELEFVYEDTTLKLYEDGTWKIDMKIFMFITFPIDQGTYTVEDDVYKFEGFEYGFPTYGEKTDDGFRIYFMDTDESFTAFTLYFEK